MSLIRMFAKAKQKQTETQNKSIEKKNNEKEDDSINPHQNVTELAKQIEPGNFLNLILYLIM